MPLDGNEARDARSVLTAKPENRSLAGQPAEVYTRVAAEGQGRVDYYQIFLPDAYLVLSVWGVPSDRLEEVLGALREVE